MYWINCINAIQNFQIKFNVQNHQTLVTINISITLSIAITQKNPWIIPAFFKRYQVKENTST